MSVVVELKLLILFNIFFSSFNPFFVEILVSIFIKLHLQLNCATLQLWTLYTSVAFLAPSKHF